MLVIQGFLCFSLKPFIPSLLNCGANSITACYCIIEYKSPSISQLEREYGYTSSTLGRLNSYGVFFSGARWNTLLQCGPIVLVYGNVWRYGAGVEMGS